MKKYLGVKLIEAEPMSKGEAWSRNLVKVDTATELTEEQSEKLYKTDGYKVVYEDGYTSWSPKDVFEKAYREIKTMDDLPQLLNEVIPEHQERVLDEMFELNKKITKLDFFIENSEIFKKLEEDEKIRLIQQVRAMEYYFSVLIERIQNFK